MQLKLQVSWQKLLMKFRLPYLITKILYLKQEWEWERSLENDFAISTSMAVSKRLPGVAPLSAKELCRNRPCVDQKVSHRASRWAITHGKPAFEGWLDVPLISLIRIQHKEFNFIPFKVPRITEAGVCFPQICMQNAPNKRSMMGRPLKKMSIITMFSH